MNRPYRRGRSGLQGLKKALTSKNISVGWLYFYIHFVTETICFFCLKKQIGDSVFMWLFPFVYDALAFVPQSLIGRLNDRFPRFNSGLAGILIMAAAGLLFRFSFPLRYLSLAVLCTGNAFTHIGGAETTLRSSGGKLAHPAVFVSGGSFGVITGRLLSETDISYFIIILLVLSAIPFTLLADTYKNPDKKAKDLCANFSYASEKFNPAFIIFASTLIVTVRGYMGYGIPTSWKKTVFQTVLLYVTMGIGKAAGGILADAFGVRRVALISAGAALPFLMFGNNHMMISLIGVMLFSMTMAITLALIVSVLKDTPGLAFGYTTIGLFLGTAPIFFFKFTKIADNCIIMAVLTVLCLAVMAVIIKKDVKTNEQF